MGYLDDGLNYVTEQVNSVSPVKIAYNEYSSKRDSQRARKNYKHRIQWMVEDAKKAGIHPLAALGFQGGVSSAANIGQDISNVGKSELSAQEQEFMSQMNALALEKARKENSLLDFQILEARNAQRDNPDQTLPTQGDGAYFKYGKDFQFIETASGDYRIVPSPDMQQVLEENPVEKARFYATNFFGTNPPSKYGISAGDGYAWKFNAVKGIYERRKIRKFKSGSGRMNQTRQKHY